MAAVQPLIFTLARIENLMYQATFDPLDMKGRIITNTTRVNNESLDEILSVFCDTIKSGLAVSPMIKIIPGKR
ncbi:MAG: NrpR regulatory domain-containing protein, partial [Methanothrix sp.]